ncbi:eIF-2-alpha kinase GCN2 [Sesamum alatum]|uniref:EIF-2-alpha kinase GCN2 n=1 Tax=Sesamum alatum TaxID=300844 RepID=A0AAE2CQG7_9LAMI|nr:eIF-2-alpha kinase GCN2 [Sesamum alatum]
MLLRVHYDIREVVTLSRLQHQHVVRYYQAWYETGSVGRDANTVSGSKTSMSSSFSYKDTGPLDQFGNEYKLESTYLYIQMEYCPRDGLSLRDKFQVSKLVDLYKRSLEEWSKKAVELEGVIKAFELSMKEYEVAKRSNGIALLEVWALKTTRQMMIKEIRKCKVIMVVKN